MLGQIGCFVGLHDCDWEYIAEKQCEQEVRNKIKVKERKTVFIILRLST